ncbi:cathepsin B [Pelomyxa schiedti]|nr:cathepsin B [Pelomyxa schiedti]
MWRRLALVACVVVILSRRVVSCVDLGEDPIVTQELVDKINSIPGLTWTAGFGSKSDLTKREARRLLGSIRDKSPGAGQMDRSDNDSVPPDVFDARVAWPNCSSIKMIRDQSECGSCWAFGAVEAMSDRECIARGYDVILSAEDMTSCSINCGGCGGGEMNCAWSTWTIKGLVTEACYPYSLPGCDHHTEDTSNPCPDRMYITPRCQSNCTVAGEKWEKYHGNFSYYVKKETAVRNEIAASGPCETDFTVYEDFFAYTGGIYQHVTGNVAGGHSVKFVGWGSENGVPYWIVANSWNSNWGENGFFRILRGTDECGIEDTCWGGQPLVVR